MKLIVSLTCSFALVILSFYQAFAKDVVDFTSACEGRQTLVKACPSGPRPPCHFTLNGRVAWVRAAYTNANHIYIQARYKNQNFNEPHVVCEAPGVLPLGEILTELGR